MSELVCVVHDKNGKRLTEEEVKKKVIDIDLYYSVMAKVKKRMDENK